MTASVTKRWRVWVALLASPALLALVFALCAGTLAVTRGLHDDALFKAVEAMAAIPTSIAFTLAFLVTRALAKSDGLSLAALGWTRPSLVDVAAGLGAAGAVWALNAAVLYPLLQEAQPSFDPTLSTFSWPAALVAMTVAVVAEDTLYRGYALRALRERHGTPIAVVVTTALYVLLTPSPELPLKLWAGFFGLVLCGLTIWRKNLWPAALAHWIVALGPKLVVTLA